MAPPADSFFRKSTLCACLLASLFGCGGKSRKNPSEAMDGFYVNKEYLEGLRKGLTIFGTPFPVRSLYLQIHGDSVELDFNNHEGLMADLVVIEGDTIRGMMGNSIHMQIAIDWLDNQPQMDYLTLARADRSFQVAYRVQSDKLELFEIDFPGNCKSFRYQECPLSDAKRGRKILVLERMR